MIKVFDSNIHITTTKFFKDYKRNIPCSYENYIKGYNKDFQLKGCIVSGLPNLEKYSLNEFINVCKTVRTNVYGFPAITKNFISGDLEEEIILFKKFGFIGCKLHPRLLNIDLDINFLLNLSKFLSKHNLILMLCTFLDEKSDDANNQIYNLKKFVDKIIQKEINLKMIFAHAGGKYFPEILDFTSSNKKILLDLSFTYQRYQNTSVEEKLIESIISNNNMISFGTDWPDYSFLDNIQILKKHKKIISDERKFEDFLYHNALNFIKN